MLWSKLSLLLVLVVAAVFTSYWYGYGSRYVFVSLIGAEEEVEAESRVGVDEIIESTETADATTEQKEEEEADLSTSFPTATESPSRKPKNNPTTTTSPTLKPTLKPTSKPTVPMKEKEEENFLRLGKPDNAKLKVFGYADKAGDGLCGLLRSMSANHLSANFWGFDVDSKCHLKQHNQNIRYIIRKKKIENYMQQSMLEANSDPNAFLVFIDSFDVLFQSDAASLIDTYVKIFGKTGYVIGAEKNCYPNMRAFTYCNKNTSIACPSFCDKIKAIQPTKLQSQYNYAYKVDGIKAFSPKLKVPWHSDAAIQFPNSGFQMGTAEGFVRYFKEYVQLEKNDKNYTFFDDQHVHLAMFANETKNLDLRDITMDLNSSLVFNGFKAEDDLRLKQNVTSSSSSNEKRPMFQHIVTKSIPPVIHLNGPAKLHGKYEALSEMLWFNTRELYHIVPDDYNFYAVSDKEKHEHSYWNCCSDFEERWFKTRFGNDTVIAKENLDWISSYSSSSKAAKSKRSQQDDTKRYENMAALLNRRKVNGTEIKKSI